MEKRKTNRRKRGGLPVEILFLSGFFVGTILPNLAWRFQWEQKYMASLGLLLTLSQASLRDGEYFLQVLCTRGSFFLLCALCGFSVFGLPLSVLAAVGEGAWTGMALSVSILQMGLLGGVVGAGLLLPHSLIYLPAFFLLLRLVGEQSLQMWKNKGLFPKKVWAYSGRCLALSILYLAGILVEAWISPWVMEKLLERINFF